MLSHRADCRLLEIVIAQLTHRQRWCMYMYIYMYMYVHVLAVYVLTGPLINVVLLL